MSKPTPKSKNDAAIALGRLGGSANTPAQRRARAENAAQGGRPRRVCNCCGKPVRGGHVDPADDDSCPRPGWHWETPSQRRRRLARKP